MVAGYPRGGGYTAFICLSANELMPVPADVDAADAHELLEWGGYASKVVLAGHG